MGRNHETKVRLERDEKEKLEKQAERYGLRLSQYIRMICINAEISIKNGS